MPDTKLQQLVEDEATRAEAQSPDDDGEAAEDDETEAPPAEPAESPAEPGTTEPEPAAEPGEEPAAPAEPSAEEIAHAENMAELEKALATYQRKVAKVLGPQGTPPECPACGGVGFDFSGGAGEPDFAAASNTTTCEECRGFGAVLTGSQVPEQRLRRCDRCKGAGYLIERPVAVENPDMVAPIVADIAAGGGNGDAAAALGPDDPGWEPWMGGAPAATPAT